MSSLPFLLFHDGIGGEKSRQICVISAILRTTRCKKGIRLTLTLKRNYAGTDEETCFLGVHPKKFSPAALAPPPGGGGGLRKPTTDYEAND